MKRRIVTTLLAAALTAAMAMPAMATQGEGVATQSQANGVPEVQGQNVITQSAVQPNVITPRVDGENSVTSIDADNNRATSSMDTVLNGTIQATQLKVTVPATVFFILDPTTSAANLATHMTQAVQPQIHITNESLVPVYAKITEVKVSQSSGNDDPNVPMALINDPQQIYGKKQVMFGFKEVGAITGWNNKYDWLMECADQQKYGNDPARGPYLLSNDRGRIEGLTYQNGTPQADFLDMKIYIRTSVGWHVRDTFTITPTIVISVLDHNTVTTNNGTSVVINSMTGGPAVVSGLETEETTPEQDELQTEESNAPAESQVDEPEAEVPQG